MMYDVDGTDQSTGQPRRLRLEAQDEHEAQQLAQQQGMIVSAVHPVWAQQAQQAVADAMGGMDAKGFFGALFDLSFTEFITTRLVKLLYILVITFGVLMALGMLIGAMSRGWGPTIGALFVAPIFLLLYIIFARVYMELIIVLFRIAENTGRMVEKMK